jgi:hypothetical protein
MRLVKTEDINTELEFAKKAAEYFSKNIEISTFTDEDIKPGCFFAVRWGMLDDCVLVLKLDKYHEPTNYMSLIKEYQKDE